MKTSVVAEKVTFENGEPGVLVKIQKKRNELNIWFKLNELSKLNKVELISWENGSIKIGTSSNSSVFWSVDKDDVSILVGQDDEIWDIGFFIKKKTLRKVITEIEKNI